MHVNWHIICHGRREGVKTLKIMIRIFTLVAGAWPKLSMTSKVRAKSTWNS